MNNPLKCIIIDDEKKDRENIRLLLESYSPDTIVIGEASTKKSILKILDTVDVDIVFTDIQLGTIFIFDILNELKILNFKIVFVTAHDKYAIKGYQYDAIDYLLKPINPVQLIKVIDRTKKIKYSTEPKNNVLINHKALNNKLTNSKISISDAKGMHILNPTDILYCVSDGNYTTFKMLNETEIVVSKNLKHFESKLSIYDFLRTHKSYLINLNHIDFIMKKQGGAIIMKNGKSLPVSRNCKQQLYTKLNIL